MGSPSPICISTSFLCLFWIDSSYSALATFTPKCAVKKDMVRVDRLARELFLKKMVSNHLTHAYSEHTRLWHGLFFKEVILIGPSTSFFWDIGNALNRSTSFDLVDLTFSVSTHGVKLWANYMDTLWELDENTLGTKPKKNKISLSAHTLKKNKKLDCPALAAWNFFFQNCLSPFSASANRRGRILRTILK